MPSSIHKLTASVREKLESLSSPKPPPSHPPTSDRSPSSAYNRPAPPVPYWTANFDPSTPVSQEWQQELGDHGWGNNELQNYTASPSNSHFCDINGQRCLKIRAIADKGKFTSARLTSKVTLGREKGYLSAQISGPSAKGIWPAFWMLPKEPFSWPTDGEVDIMESWNGLRTNHSCLHWGHYNGQDYDKHRVIETPVPAVDHPNGQQYGFAWNGPIGKLLWFINDQPVMQADIPQGTRSITDFQIKLNVAMGGTVNQGQSPADGIYEMIIHQVGMFEAPPGGWDRFEKLVRSTPEGHTM